MMALTMAFVGETVPKAKTGSAMGLLGTMSAIGTALGPSLGGVLIAGLGWRASFSIKVPLGILALFLAHRYLPNDRQGPKTRAPRLRPCGHAAAGTDARGLCARHDDGARQFRPSTSLCCWLLPSEPASSCLPRNESSITFDSIGDVPQSRAEFESRHERARLDGDDGDAGGRAVLSFACARARRRACRTRLVGRPACCRTERRASRTHVPTGLGHHA
jgi:hypothetical protein